MTRKTRWCFFVGFCGWAGMNLFFIVRGDSYSLVCCIAFMLLAAGAIHAGCALWRSR